MNNVISVDATARSRRDFFAKASAFLAVAGIAPMLEAQTTTPMSDVDVLNFALRLERLEASFYTVGLSKFAATDFAAAAFAKNLTASQAANAYTYFQAIQGHEQTHVMQITAAIMAMGGTPVAVDCYGFQAFGSDTKTFASADSFVAVAMVLENTGVMAYDGAIQLISAVNLRTTAATIATVEARHAAYLNQLNGVIPFPAAFDTPGTVAGILTAASAFITSCSTFPANAIAGPKNITTASKTFQLDGTASTGAAGSTVATYQWETVLGSIASVTNANSPKPTVTFNGGPGLYAFGLVIVDANGNSGTDVVKVNYTGA